MKKTRNPYGATMRRQAGRAYVDDLANGRKPSMKKAMLKAGYTQATAISGTRQHNVRESQEFEEELKRYNADLKEIRDLSIANAIKKASNATFRDSVNAIDTLDKIKMRNESSNVDYFGDEDNTDVILERIQRITLKNKSI